MGLARGLNAEDAERWLFNLSLAFKIWPQHWRHGPEVGGIGADLALLTATQDGPYAEVLQNRGPQESLLTEVLQDVLRHRQTLEVRCAELGMDEAKIFSRTPPTEWPTQ